MNIKTAMAHARHAEKQDLQGVYPMVARVLAEEVNRLTLLVPENMQNMTAVPNETWSVVMNLVHGPYSEPI